MTNVKKWLIESVKIGLALGIMIFILYKKINVREIIPNIRAAGTPGLLACWFSYAMVWLLSTSRWFIIIRGEEVRARYWRIMEYYLIGLFFNNIMLGSMGGDVVKAYYLARDLPAKREAGVMTVIFDRLIGFITIFAIGFVGLLLNIRTPEIRPVAYLFVLFFVVILIGLIFAYTFDRWVCVRPFVWIWRYMPFKENIERLHEAFYQYRYRKKLLLGAVLISALMQITNITIIYFIAFLMGMSALEYRYLLLFMPVIGTVFSLPITPSGWGTGEIAFYKLFGLIGISADSALSLDIVMRMMIISWGLLGGALYASSGLRIRGKVNKIGAL